MDEISKSTDSAAKPENDAKVSGLMGYSSETPAVKTESAPKKKETNSPRNRFITASKAARDKAIFLNSLGADTDDSSRKKAQKALDTQINNMRRHATDAGIEDLEDRIAAAQKGEFNPLESKRKENEDIQLDREAYKKYLLGKNEGDLTPQEKDDLADYLFLDKHPINLDKMPNDTSKILAQNAFNDNLEEYSELREKYMNDELSPDEEKHFEDIWNSIGYWGDVLGMDTDAIEKKISEAELGQTPGYIDPMGKKRDSRVSAVKSGVLTSDQIAKMKAFQESMGYTDEEMAQIIKNIKAGNR